SRAYREGRSLESHRTPEGRAAYLVHTLAAHVCDGRRLLLDELEGELRRKELRVVALGAGPGTEGLALAEAWGTGAARTGEAPGEVVRVDRVDRVRDWDGEAEALARETMVSLAALDPGAGVAWRLEAPPAMVADLAQSSWGEAVLARAREADLV